MDLSDLTIVKRTVKAIARTIEHVIQILSKCFQTD